MKEIKRLIPNLKLNFFLFGPRGTGKSTWLSRISKNALIIDLLDEITYRSLLSRPERLVELIEGNPENDTIIIYEVKKIPYYPVTRCFFAFLKDFSRLDFESGRVSAHGTAFSSS